MSSSASNNYDGVPGEVAGELAGELIGGELSVAAGFADASAGSGDGLAGSSAIGSGSSGGSHAAAGFANRSDYGNYGGPVGPRGAFARSGRRPPKLYRIGDIIDYSGLSRQTIHNYTAMGLIRESRWTPGGHRLYDESVFDRLDKVLTMKRHRKSIREIREYFAAEESSQNN